MSEPLPPMGLASDLAADPQTLASFVRAVGPSAHAPVPAPVPHDQLVAFLLEDELFTVPVVRVREIVRVAQLTRIPQAPPHVRGVQNLRGTVLPVLEIRTRIGLTPAVIGPGTRIVVAEAEQRLVGLLVDSVVRVASVPRRDIAPPPPEVRSQISDYVLGTAPIAGSTSLLLDLDGLLTLPAPSGEQRG
ncbi:MAG: chemotaxis protein CheW [Myxococcaceae bacterium]